jgi:hypothetical protein
MQMRQDSSLRSSNIMYMHADSPRQGFREATLMKPVRGGSGNPLEYMLRMLFYACVCVHVIYYFCACRDDNTNHLRTGTGVGGSHTVSHEMFTQCAVCE